MSHHGNQDLGRIATGVARAARRRQLLGERGETATTTLGRGQGWRVDDVLCTHGPDDRSFEERHSGVSIAVVLAGTFQVRGSHSRDLLTPGSLLLGNDGESFECGHEHAIGDRCLAFRFAPDFFERLAADLGGRAALRVFRVGRLPPLRALAPVVARSAAGVLRAAGTAWDELALELAATALAVANAVPLSSRTPAGAEARITTSVRAIEAEPGLPHSLQELADRAHLSPYHYLRTFRRVTGVTPHQFILRTRLREAATRLATAPDKVVEVALEAGFNDLSHFNHLFQAEFGMNPSALRTAGSWRRPRVAEGPDPGGVALTGGRR